MLLKLRFDLEAGCWPEIVGLFARGGENEISQKASDASFCFWTAASTAYGGMQQQLSGFGVGINHLIPGRQQRN